jgi:hypothetical protein
MSEAFIPRVQKDIKSEKVSLDDFRKQQLLKLLKSDGWNLKVH